MKESNFQDEGWSKKRIIIFLVILFLIIGGFLGKLYFIDKINPLKDISQIGRVKGITTVSRNINSSESPSDIIKNGIQDKIDAIKQEAASIDTKDVSSSSSQVQKIINDLKSLENVPKSQAKEMCKKMCDGI